MMCMAKMAMSMPAHLHRQRCVEGPARGGGAARHEERQHQQQRGRRHQPEAEVVHPREGHVGGADLQRDHPVREPHEGRHDGAEHHDRAVHGGELVEQFGAEELQARLEQLEADQQRQHAAGQQHGEGEQQVQRADVLVVGGEQPAAPAVRVVVGVIVVAVLVRMGQCVRASSTHSGTPEILFFPCVHDQPATRLPARLACLPAALSSALGSPAPAAPPPSGNFAGAGTGEVARLDHLAGMVAPVVAGEGHHRRQLRVRQVLPHGHRALALEQDVHLAGIRAIDDLGAVQCRERSAALAVGLVADRAVGG